MYATRMRDNADVDVHNKAQAGPTSGLDVIWINPKQTCKRLCSLPSPRPGRHGHGAITLERRHSTAARMSKRQQAMINFVYEALSSLTPAIAAPSPLIAKFSLNPRAFGSHVNA